jgi:hypothetical protein
MEAGLGRIVGRRGESPFGPPADMMLGSWIPALGLVGP